MAVLLWAVLVFVHGDPISDLQSIIKESLKAHCPLQGFNGTFCPSSTTSSPNQKQQPGDTLPHLPGKLGLGYDTATVRLKLPALAFNYSLTGQVWTNSQGQRFRVPDEVLLRNAPLVSPRQTIALQTPLDYLTYLNSQTHFTDYQHHFIGGQFTHLPTFPKATLNFFNHGVTSMASAQDNYGLYNLTLRRGALLSLDKWFVEALGVLPEIYDPFVYKEFLAGWGTHYVTGALFGGMVEATTVWSRCLYSTFNKSRLEEEIEVVLDFLKDPTMDHRTPYITNRTRMTSFMVSGGDPSVTGWKNRINTCEGNPAITKFVYRPITDLIVNPIKRANVREALRDAKIEVPYAHPVEIAEANAQEHITAVKPRKVTFIGTFPKSLSFDMTSRGIYMSDNDKDASPCWGCERDPTTGSLRQITHTYAAGGSLLPTNLRNQGEWVDPLIGGCSEGDGGKCCFTCE